mmetsp:Transcript_48554/g.100404  ORF Transcript_48554/g.100404 Transcript_48554/m.100404 type:complete len:276 (+) Transcript_48554:380-1207(+)
MLAAQVHAPLHGHLEACGGRLLDQDLDSLGVTDAGEGLCEKILQALYQPLLHVGIEPYQVLTVVIHGIAHAELQIVLGTLHIVVDVGKGQLWLDHPELSQMPGGVRVLCPESGSEGVDIRERTAVVLHAELTAHGEEGRLPEEVLGVVDLALVPRQPFFLFVCEQRCDLEHLARALAIRCGNERSVHVEEALGPEELMSRLCQGSPDACHRSDEVGPRPEVGDRAEVLHAVALLRQGVLLGVDPPEQEDLVRRTLNEELHRLLAAGRRHKLAGAL